MEKDAEVTERVEVLFAVEGQARHHSATIDPNIIVREFFDIAVTASGVDELVEVYLENAEVPLDHQLVLAEHLSIEFAPLHVATPGKIKTTVRYQDRHVVREFSAAVTVAAITEWAVGKDGLNLEGDPSDFQLKLDGEVLAPDNHLGQVARGKKEVTFDLVFKVKPQGYS
jgi:hypothetical protein